MCIIHVHDDVISGRCHRRGSTDDLFTGTLRDVSLLSSRQRLTSSHRAIDMLTTAARHRPPSTFAGVSSKQQISRQQTRRFCLAVLCKSAAYAVVRLSVTFVYSVATSRRIFNFFHHRVATPFQTL